MMAVMIIIKTNKQNNWHTVFHIIIIIHLKGNGEIIQSIMDGKCTTEIILKMIPPVF